MNNDTFAHRRAFYFLKKYSSYTWSNEIFKLTKEFSEKLEQILRHPPAGFGEAIDLDEMFMVECWDACGKMEEGLTLLLQSDRLLGYARFSEGASFASSALFGDADRGAPRRYIWNDTNEAKYNGLGYSSYYDTVSGGIFALLERASSLANYSLATTVTRTDNTWNHPELLNNFRWPEPIANNIREVTFPFPRWHPAPLQPVPQPTKEGMVIMSGNEVPVTGIWQPEPLKPMDTPELRAWDIVSENYCMNFLVQGRDAPEMYAQELEESWFAEGAKHQYQKRPKGYSPTRAVRWRLLWIDDRYGDNGITEEEKDYLRTDAPVIASSVVIDMLRVEGGKACTQPGFWFTPAKTNSRRFFKQDEMMPSLGTDYGVTIWQWDQNQEMPKL